MVGLDQRRQTNSKSQELGLVVQDHTWGTEQDE